MVLDAGTRIGPYEIVSVIGSGGMGTVYLARDSRLHRRIALKFIQTDSLSGDEDAVSRLLHEARAASALNHPSVCQVYDVGGEGRDSWIAMEYVEGRPLAAVIPPGGLPPGEVVRLGAQIAEALAHAHERGVLHRDLKTANIVCDSAGRAKILDFGIARRLHVPQDVTTTRVPVDSAVAGTLAYMAPEVVRGEPQDERSDLWSLGVVLYEMASGRRPFEGTNVFDVAGAVVRDAPPQLPEHVTTSLRSVVERLLAKSPAERYRGAGEVAAALTVLRAPQSRSPRPAARIWLPIALIVLTGLMGLLWLRRGADVAMRITHQQLVSPAGAGHKAPAYSPDGNRIAFTGPDPSGVDQVWVQEIGSGAAIQLTHDAVAANHPRWLGSDRLLYASGGRGLWTIPSLGGTPTRLVEAGTNPDVSRDGTRIVFEAQRGLWTARSDGSEVRKIEGTAPVYYRLPMGPALSPDATSVAYFHAAVGPNGDFWVIPLSGGKPKQLTSDLREGGWPVWTPDGRSIIFSSARAGSRTLWRVSAGGGEPTPVTTGAGEDDQPHISADGRLLAYTNVRNSWELKTLDLTSRSMQTLMRRGLEIIFPVFSPDGRRIAYFGRADEAVAVFTIGVDGSDPRQLTAGRELNHSPRWSADGQEIYFYQLHPTIALRRMSALGGPSREFRKWEWQTQNSVQFDPSGERIVYVQQRPLGAPSSQAEHTVIHHVSTGREEVWPEPHTHPGGWLSADSFVGWQHDPAGGLHTIVICRVVDRSCHAVTRGLAVRWSKWDDRVYFLRPAGVDYQLFSSKVDGTDEQSILNLGTFRLIDVLFDVSSAGRIVWAPFHAGRPELWTATLAKDTP